MTDLGAEVRREASPSPMLQVAAGSTLNGYWEDSRASFRSMDMPDMRSPARAQHRLRKTALSGLPNSIASKPTYAVSTPKLAWLEGKSGQRR
jgi:hypothetical protein